MITKVRLFLMFEGKAEEAMNFYVSLIPGGKIIDVVRYRRFPMVAPCSCRWEIMGSSVSSPGSMTASVSPGN